MPPSATTHSSTGRRPADPKFDRKVTFSLGRETVSLPPRLVTLLIESLRQLASTDGDAVADEVSSLASAGVRVDLRLSAGELGVLAEAITRMSPKSRPLDPNFVRLLSQLRERQVG